jgi:hypothetical protein
MSKPKEIFIIINTGGGGHVTRAFADSRNCVDYLKGVHASKRQITEVMAMEDGDFRSEPKRKIYSLDNFIGEYDVSSMRDSPSIAIDADTLRDQIMMAVLPAIITKNNPGDASKSSHDSWIKRVVYESYRIADEALDQKMKREESLQ